MVSFLGNFIIIKKFNIPSTSLEKIGNELKLNNVCDVVFGDNM